MREETLPPASRWREWLFVLADRDRISCMQSGPNGPPFAKTYSVARSLLRYLPWNWYSIDGTGWCYDTAWDEMRKCDEIDAPIDANGVSVMPDDVVDPSALQPVELFVIACVAIGLGARLAYHNWVAQQARLRDVEEAHDTAHDGEDAAAKAAFAAAALTSAPNSETTTLRRWLHSGAAWPWRWDTPAWLAVLGGMLGLAGAMTVPLPGYLLQRLAGAEAGSSRDAELDSADASW